MRHQPLSGSLLLALLFASGCAAARTTACLTARDCDAPLVCVAATCTRGPAPRDVGATQGDSDPGADAARPGSDAGPRPDADGPPSDAGGSGLDAERTPLDGGAGVDAALASDDGSAALTDAWLPPMDAGAVDPAVIQGFGSDTPGGSGMPPLHVTNLNASGPGSLLEAVQYDRRTIVFDVGGVIDAPDNVGVLGRAFITIDGFSAPAPGITLTSGGLIIEGSHDIIVRGIRVRGAGDDGLRAFGSHHIVFDHCSSANNGGGNLDVTADSHDVTIQYCILGAAVAGSMLIAFDTQHVTVHHNLFHSQQDSGVGERSPLVHAAPATSAVAYLMADIRNNVVWGWGRDRGTSYGYGTGLDYGATANIINNFYETNSGPLTDLAIELDHEASGSAAYTIGNVSGNGLDLSGVGNRATEFTAAPVATEPACLAASRVLASAGVRPLDAIDAALLGDVTLARCR